jgi:hypothetical protein
MFYQVCGCVFGFLMAIHYYLILVFLPALLEAFLGDD